MLAELLCAHGYDTWLSSEEQDMMNHLPTSVNNLTDRGKEVCRILLRKNMIHIKNGKVKCANRDNLKEVISWFLN